MNDIYQKLCRITQENMSRHNAKTIIHFERPEGLQHSIFSYPQEALLAIDKSECFVRECFYKILDRPVDEISFKNFVWALNNRTMSKQELINQLYHSAERIQKQTDLKI